MTAIWNRILGDAEVGQINPTFGTGESAAVSRPRGHLLQFGGIFNRTDDATAVGKGLVASPPSSSMESVEVTNKPRMEAGNLSQARDGMLSRQGKFLSEKHMPVIVFL